MSPVKEIKFALSSSPSNKSSTKTSLHSSPVPNANPSSPPSTVASDTVRKGPKLILNPPKPPIETEQSEIEQVEAPKMTAIQRRIARGKKVPTANLRNYPESRMPLGVAIWIAQKIDLVTNNSFLDQVLSAKDKKKSKKEKEKIAQRLRKTRSRMTNWAKSESLIHILYNN